MFKLENNNAVNCFAIDPGAFRTRFYSPGAGILLDQPSIAALDIDDPVGGSNALRSFGDRADELTSTHIDGLRPVRPVQADQHNDLGWGSRMLEHFLAQVYPSGVTVRSPEIVVMQPHDCSTTATSRLLKSCEATCAVSVRALDAALAAFYSTELDRSEPCIIIDFGATTTRLFAIADGEVVYYENLPFGGDSLDKAIATGLLERFSLYVSDETARHIKHSVAAATPQSIVKCTRTSCPVECLSVKTNITSTYSISSETINQILHPTLDSLANSIAAGLANIDSHIIDAAYATGIRLCGGGALLSRMDQLVIQATNLPVETASQPLTSNVRGAASTIAAKPVQVQSETPKESLAAIG